MNPRVLMVTRETAEDRKYGLGRSLAPLLEPMRACGVDVRYFCQEDLPATLLDKRRERSAWMAGLPGLRDHPLRQNLANAWQERLQVGAEAARIAIAQGYTHVHAHDPWIACGAAWGLLAGGGRGVRWGFTQHGFGSYSQATHEDGLTQGPRTMAWMRRIERWIANRAAWVLAPTAASLAQLARELGLPAPSAHWHHVPHPRPPLQVASEAQRHEARAALGYAEEDISVLAVGRLAPLKCFDRIVRACAAQRDGRVRLLVLGAGDSSGLTALARELGFDRLDIQSTQDVAPYYHAADIYMSASSTESFGMANLEALCAGLPAICSPVGGVPEVMGDGAWLVPNDADSLEGALAALCADPALRRAWSERAIERASGWPGPVEVAQRYVAIYQAA
ncbi:glycosyltransferase family 4 protein [Caenimonas aquaedulcis]|uniref:Glycosyltransferase family 4 protein n=1 Tax=Caenimonas aquaedulcis TaxID=2793270 RepID=A0A931H6W7_9BURK|nr:glycosyltransferase family 4 protein [Caenimonas aquaedulcis]MBG9389781.1 glycosyltransferase family 4 protein [Caenimonas aquaedulcis]